jgi:hypothetical protein
LLSVSLHGLGRSRHWREDAYDMTPPMIGKKRKAKASIRQMVDVRLRQAWLVLPVSMKFVSLYM